MHIPTFHAAAHGLQLACSSDHQRLVCIACALSGSKDKGLQAKCSTKHLPGRTCTHSMVQTAEQKTRLRYKSDLRNGIEPPTRKEANQRIVEEVRAELAREMAKGAEEIAAKAAKGKRSIQDVGGQAIQQIKNAAAGEKEKIDECTAAAAAKAVRKALKKHKAEFLTPTADSVMASVKPAPQDSAQDAPDVQPLGRTLDPALSEGGITQEERMPIESKEFSATCFGLAPTPTAIPEQEASAEEPGANASVSALLPATPQQHAQPLLPTGVVEEPAISAEPTLTENPEHARWSDG